MSLWNKIVSSAMMVWGSIFGAAGTPVAMNPSSFVPQLPLVQEIILDESDARTTGANLEQNTITPTAISAEEYEAELKTAQAPEGERVVREIARARITATAYEDARIAFAIPAGYEVSVSTSTVSTSMSTSTKASTTTPAVFNTHIEVAKPELVSASPGLPKTELASIKVDVLTNPENLSAREWVEAHVQVDESEIIEYQFAGRTGVRWVPPAGYHRAEAVALSANGYIIRVQHAYETEEEEEAFNELLSSFTLKEE